MGRAGLGARPHLRRRAHKTAHSTHMALGRNRTDEASTAASFTLALVAPAAIALALCTAFGLWQPRRCAATRSRAEVPASPARGASSACAGSVTDGLKGEGHADAATQRLVLRVRGSTLRAAVVRHHGGLNVTLSERPSDAEASVSNVAEAEAVQALNPMKAKCLIASCVPVCLEVLSMPRDTHIVPVKAWMAWCLPHANLAAL